MNMMTNYFSKSLITVYAINKPALEGTKALLPGVFYFLAKGYCSLE